MKVIQNPKSKVHNPKSYLFISIKRCTVVINTIVILSIVTAFVVLMTMYPLSVNTHVPLIVFKVPRSGSSWFTALLNEIPNVYISKEIIQAHDTPGIYNIQDITTFLIRALKQPTDKLSSYKWYLPFTGRFYSDYVKTFKFIKQMSIIGFTINPEHVKGIDWDEVISSVPNLKVLVLIRSNVIKMSFSRLQGALTSKLCKTSNIRSGIYLFILFF